MGRVIVVGSLNIDLVVRAPRLPGPGVTVTGGDLARYQGGKGGNQAVAAARLGAEVAFVGAVGDDGFGQSALRALADEGVAIGEVASVARSTGVALIVVDDSGQNQIAVAPGANASVDGSMVESALARLGLSREDVVLVVREVPPDAVRSTLAAGRAAGALTILNPAPAQGLNPGTRGLADVLTPNESELETLAGVGSTAEAARRLLTYGGSRWLAVTLGDRGAALIERDGSPIEIPAPHVEPVDTTGAGDAFNGALAALLAAGRTPDDAVGRAVAAASLSTTRAGAREGMPTAAELGAFLVAGRASG